MSNQTLFPVWLQNSIAKKGGKYLSNFKKAQNNLNNSHEDNLNYLHTYFPRTLNEVQNIFNLLEETSSLFNYINYKKNIKILSIGCGTGADVIGILFSLKDKFKSANFDISLIDGNEDALNQCSDLLDDFIYNEQVPINKNIYNFQIKNINDFKEIAKNFADNKFDFIITSKFLNELLNIINNPYGNFVNIFKSCLSQDGVMILLDTTNRVIDDYNPVFLNFEINKDLEKDPDFACLLPIPCRLSRSCNKKCFTCFKNKYENKYTFKVISRTRFTEEICNKKLNICEKYFAIVGSVRNPSNFRLCPNFIN